jgi:hypothetical protein
MAFFHHEPGRIINFIGKRGKMLQVLGSEQKALSSKHKSEILRFAQNDISRRYNFLPLKLAGLDGLAYPGKFVIVFKSCKVSEKVRLRKGLRDLRRLESLCRQPCTSPPNSTCKESGDDR